jgi:L-2,4-diaminobutyrate decarboxylase
VHEPDVELIDAALAFTRRQLTSRRPLIGPTSADELAVLLKGALEGDGAGPKEAFRLLTEVIAPACMAIDHPRVLAFVPSAPTPAALAADVVLSALNVIADWWIEGSGAIAAENEALAWLASHFGLPATAGGVFVSGATPGNLAALAAARHWWRRTRHLHHDPNPPRNAIAVSGGGHASLRLVARTMDCAVVEVPADNEGRMQADTLEATLAAWEASGGAPVCAVAATGGTTNAGVVDHLDAIAGVCQERGLWLHVDAAYGGAAMLSPRTRPLFRGIDRVDSMVVDPHKWLFSGYDSCALLYADSREGQAAHTQQGEYLETLFANPEHNPSDFAVHLTRRARGVPFWFSLAVNGGDAYTAAVEACLDLAIGSARLIDAASHTELVMEPELSVVLFRRVGWSRDDLQRWSDRALESGFAFVTPTTWRGEAVLRLCFVNPRTTLDDVAAILDALA